MRWWKLLVCLAIAALSLSNAWGQQPPPAMDKKGAVAIQPDARKNIAVAMFSIADKAYAGGAKCDGATDDTAAINAAAAAFRTAVNASYKKAILTGPLDGSVCVALSTINLTGINSYQSAIIDLPPIRSKAAGQIAIDATDTRVLHWRDLRLEGDCTAVPRIGLQLARSVAANKNKFTHPVIKGCFTFASLYVFAAEENVWDKPVLWNSQPDPASFVLVLDGINHWNAASAFFPISQPVDTQTSFNDPSFINATIQHFGGGVPLWLGGVTHAHFIDSYASNTLGTPCGILYVSPGIIQAFDGEIHCETDSLTDVWLLQANGSNIAASLRGFRYRDYATHASNSIFKTDSNIASVSVENFEVTIDHGSGGIVNKLFDNPSLWTVKGGKAWLPADAYWSGPPGAYTGCVGTPTSRQCSSGTKPASPYGNMIINGRMRIDRQNNGSSTSGSGRFVDKFIRDTRGSPTLNLRGQRTTNSPPAGYQHSLQISANTGISLSNAQSISLRHAVEGTALDGRGWGGSAAQPLTCGFWTKSSLTGDFPFSVRNSSANRSYVATYNIPTANGWVYRSLTIPGDQTGSWATGPNVVGLNLHWNLGAGGDFQTAPNAWVDGLFFATSGTVPFVTNTGATWNVTGVHCNFGLLDEGDQTVSYDLDSLRALRFYETSFLEGVNPAQNAGPINAASFQAPYAQATKGTASRGVPFRVPKYVNGGSTLPTMTFYSTGAGSANCYDSDQAADVGAASAANLGDSGFTLQCNLHGAAIDAALGDLVQIHWEADTGF